MFKRILFTVLFLLLATQLVLAHEVWIEQRNGELVVLYGHGKKIDTYDPSSVKEPKAFDSKGGALPIEIVGKKDGASLASKEKPAMVTASYEGGYWMKTTDGWKKATKREAQGKFSIVEAIESRKCAKACLAPCEALSKPVGLSLEIVPEKDPFAIKPGEALSLKVLRDGKPIEGAVIVTGDMSHSQAKDMLKTDKDGRVSVTIAKPGPQMIIASYKAPIKGDPDADILSLASSLTFEVK